MSNELTERQRLINWAKELASPDWCLSVPVPAKQAITQLLAALEPQQITTPEELKALPVGSAVVDWKGSIYEKDAEDEAPDLPWWLTPGDQRRYAASRITLPAIILHIGGTR